MVVQQRPLDALGRRRDRQTMVVLVAPRPREPVGHVADPEAQGVDPEGNDRLGFAGAEREVAELPDAAAQRLVDRQRPALHSVVDLVGDAAGPPEPERPTDAPLVPGADREYRLRPLRARPA